MSNFSVVVCLFLVFFCIFQLNNAAGIRYTFKGGAGCTVGGNPCDFDSPDYWTVQVLTKRGVEEAFDEPTSPALQTKLYDIIMPYAYVNSAYILQTHNTTGYTIDTIYYENNLKRDELDIESVQGKDSPGATIIFSNTKLNLYKFNVGGGSTRHKLVFENTEIIVGSGSNQNGNSIVHFKGTTKATMSSSITIRGLDTLIVDEEATIKVNTTGQFLISNGGDQTINILGTLILDGVWNFNVGGSTRDSIAVTLTNANVTAKPPGYSYFSTPIYIGKESADAGKITYWKTPISFEVNPVTINAKTIAYLNLYFTYRQVITVDGESTLYVVPSDGLDTYYHCQASFVAKGNGAVYFDSSVYVTYGIEKRDVLGDVGPFFHNFTVYDGLMQFNDVVTIDSEPMYFRTKSSAAVLTLNGKLECKSNNQANFEFVAGSTVSLNNLIAGCTNVLPTNGVNYEFGSYTYSSPIPPSLNVTNNGSITLKGSTLIGYNVTVEDSTFGGYGDVELDVTLSKTTGTPKLALSSIGKTLTINGTLTIPTGSVISITADSNSCGNLVVGTLDISSSVSILLDFVGSPPTQNKTYIIVAEYSTFTGTLPQSPDEQVYQVENDTQNKQVKVHYIYTPPPTNPPTEPTIPNDPNSPNQTPTDLPPTNSQPPTPATANSILPRTILLALLGALFM